MKYILGCIHTHTLKRAGQSTGSRRFLTFLNILTHPGTMRYSLMNLKISLLSNPHQQFMKNAQELLLYIPIKAWCAIPRTKPWLGHCPYQHSTQMSPYLISFSLPVNNDLLDTLTHEHKHTSPVSRWWLGRCCWRIDWIGDVEHSSIERSTVRACPVWP